MLPAQLPFVAAARLKVCRTHNGFIGPDRQVRGTCDLLSDRATNGIAGTRTDLLALPREYARLYR